MSDYVFVYGTLKRGEANHRLLAGAEYVCDARASNCVLVDLGGCPGMLIGSSDLECAATGEVFKFDDVNVLRTLDQLEQEGSMYKRIMIPLYIEDEMRMCWTYVLLHVIPSEVTIKDGIWTSTIPQTTGP
jgi:gamma-glutamylcyclotransferase (GGCT)/AIG2-like uncharacterized protein YtfP